VACQTAEVRFRPVALIALIAGVLVGCTSSGHSASTDPASSPALSSAPVTSGSPSASPSPTIATTGPNVRPGEKPPVLPDLATRNSRAGAAEFARYWFAALDWGYATTDSTLAKTLYLPACTDCARFMKNFDNAKARSQHFSGGRAAVTNVAVARNDHRQRADTAIDVTIAVGALRTVDASGHVVSSAPQIDAITYRVWLRRVSSRWAVVDFKQAVA
jgi:hypothetical protein